MLICFSVPESQAQREQDKEQICFMQSRRKRKARIKNSDWYLQIAGLGEGH